MRETSVSYHLAVCVQGGWLLDISAQGPTFHGDLVLASAGSGCDVHMDGDLAHGVLGGAACKEVEVTARALGFLGDGCHQFCIRELGG